MCCSPKPINIPYSNKCIICGNIMRGMMTYPSIGSVYSCESRMCCDVMPYTRYMVTYEDDIKCTSAQIILKVDEENYRLSSNSAQNITQFGKITYFIESESASAHIHKEICSFNYVLDWYDVLSAKNVIIRLLNIKAFS